MLLRNGGIALGLILIPGFFFVHHVIGTIGFVVKDKSQIITVLTNAISSHSRTGYIAFNLFLDLFLAIHVKAREYRFCRKGRTHEEYMEFQKTNQNSFHFGVLLAISMLITGLVDAGLAFLINNYQFVSLGIAENVDQKLQVYMTTHALGFGKASSSMVIAAPLMLLYSFNRVPKRKIISLLVPAAAIALALILVIEGLHLGIGVYLRGITDESGLIPGGLDSLNDILGGM